ncbi:MAG: hypothetical protein ACXVZJ_12085 [Terriglobales bacterium]
MTNYTTTRRLEGLRKSLEAARDVAHPPTPLTGVHLATYEQHLRGVRAGLQLAIDAIDTEIRVIAAGEAAAARFNQ